ncbi:MAG: OmpA family protein [Ferruginibacter sp.]|nr:OmpA family protein [Chitinophagaceae bacterium]MBK9530274.1 OmpA family protein [Chitinophagaceae bacterium]
MKQKLTLVLALALLATSAFSQKNTRKGEKKGPLFGLHYNMQDFQAPLGIKDPITGKVYSKFKDMDKGFSLSYWKGIHPKIDVAIKANFSFRDYRAIRTGQTQKTEFGAELEPTLNLRPFDDAALLNPFLTVGAGAGYYTDKFGFYIPAGLGLQVNFNSITYMFIQANYRWDLTKKDPAYGNKKVTGDNIFYSIGLAQNIGKEKAPPPPPPPPPPPVVLDRDGDGVLDADDKCPDVAGLASLQGCPDRDGDGIADGDDKCPDVPGLARYQGCPIPDTDGDGINDEVDKCPTVPGLARYQGCPIPDTDGDGVNDEEDKCINEKGPASNFGCPVISEEIIKRVKLAAQNIFFETAKSKLLAKSFPKLNDVVTILNENPSFKVQIDGHTDSQGGDEYNQGLSEERAAAVRAYLVSKGIDEGRLASAGYGETTPVADNKTAAGRAKNRRVEMTLRNY